jgi:hypothetical protein
MTLLVVAQWKEPSSVTLQLPGCPGTCARMWFPFCCCRLGRGRRVGRVRRVSDSSRELAAVLLDRMACRLSRRVLSGRVVRVGTRA